MVKVRELMTANPAFARPDQSVQDAAAMMRQNDCGCLPVEENGHVVGVVTDRDIVTRAIAMGRGTETAVREVMSERPSCCSPDDDIALVQSLMADRKIRRVPVVDGKGHAVGMVAQADLARAAGEREEISEQEIAQVLEKVSEPGGRTVH
jgi:CBS domain-containing protein